MACSAGYGIRVDPMDLLCCYCDARGTVLSCDCARRGRLHTYYCEDKTCPQCDGAGFRVTFCDECDAVIGAGCKASRNDTVRGYEVHYGDWSMSPIIDETFHACSTRCALRLFASVYARAQHRRAAAMA